MEFAVSYKVKTFLGDEKINAVRVSGGLNLERLIKKIESYDDLSLGEIRIYEPKTMQLSEWKDEDKNIYLYHEYSDDGPYGKTLNELFIHQSHAKQELLIRFAEYAKERFRDTPKEYDAEHIGQFLEEKGMDNINVAENEISFICDDDKYWWKISELTLADS